MVTTTRKIDPATLAILADCTVVADAIKLPVGKLERKQYEAVNKILELMGGKWNRKAQAHVFSENPADLLDTVVLTAEITDKKKQFQAFYTPVALADRMVQKTNLVFGSEVLEPSAGTGRILNSLHGLKVNITAIELDEARTEMQGLAGRWFYGDFLTFTPDLIGTFSAVIMNPPFTQGQDIRHILHARRFLKPTGRLVAICSNGPKQAEALKPLAIDWEDLPAGTFAESGTNVSTALVVIGA